MPGHRIEKFCHVLDGKRSVLMEAFFEYDPSLLLSVCYSEF
jgi:hypothetical protein